LSCSGAYRVANGSDTLLFHGPRASESVRPRLELQVEGDGPVGIVVQPSPTPPPTVPGLIVNGSRTSIEITCEGGAFSSLHTPALTPRLLS
jgi:hypothetical protein